MAKKLLLREDVENLGNKGDIVKVKPGFARNFLIPKGFAVVASAQTLKEQERLKKERLAQTLSDKKDSEAIALRLKDVVLNVAVKVDQDGHMYGSVATADVVELLETQAKITLDKKTIHLKNPLRSLGEHEVPLKLKEGVQAFVHVLIASEE